jgi:Kdo2-lipid IVA lauroyltransferase/acyltransferase
MDRATTVKMIIGTFRLIPRKLRIALFTACFRLFYHISTKHRMITLHNLRCAFPEKDMKELVEIAKGAYRNVGVIAGEFFDIPYLTKENIGELVEFEGLENCTGAYGKKKGVLFLGAHFGNWELSAAAYSLYVGPAIVLYRPLDNPFLEELVRYVRTSTGNVLLPMTRAMRPMIRAFQNNETVGLMIDQNYAWQEGVFVDFFGRPACTTNGPALLAMHTDAAVIPAYLVRLPDGRHRLVIEEEFTLVRTGNRIEDAIANTQLFTKKFEEIVRRYPDHWLWLHQRWKTKKWQAVRVREANG